MQYVMYFRFFVNDVIFSHNAGPITDTGLESATQLIIYRNSLDGAAKLRILGRSLLLPIALLLSHSFNLVPMYHMRWLNPAKRGNNSDSLAKRYGDVQRFFYSEMYAAFEFQHQLRPSSLSDCYADSLSYVAILLFRALALCWLKLTRLHSASLLTEQRHDGGSEFPSLRAPVVINQSL